ncbi:MAG: hypothetical protein HY329_22080 [Chloroflexi bacterium]|nr:hypothetical protein [Chloroflexota bacterium]
MGGAREPLTAQSLQLGVELGPPPLVDRGQVPRREAGEVDLAGGLDGEVGEGVGSGAGEEDVLVLGEDGGAGGVDGVGFGVEDADRLGAGRGLAGLEVEGTERVPPASRKGAQTAGRATS